MKKWQFCILIAIVSAVVNEWWMYIIMLQFYWPNLPNYSVESVKLLLVADPQLLGEHLTASGLFGFFARWDADRYVAKTFNLAYHYTEPDLVIFLGDNMDEGEIATDDEFLRYLRRFKAIFHAVNFSRAIVLCGDNDIGGEHEPPYIEYEQRFNRYFNNEYIIKYKFLELIKVNYLTQSTDFIELPKVLGNIRRVILSHIPLTPMYSGYTEKVLQHLRPHLVLSAHEHTSMHFVSERNSGKRILTETSFSMDGMHTLNLSISEIHEILVPTCSYRMGVEKMGYGVLMLGLNNEFSYAVLWLPSRIHQLVWYLIISVIMIILLLPKSFWYMINISLLERKNFRLLGKRM